MGNMEAAAKLEKAAKLLHGAASAFRRGDRHAGFCKWDEARDTLDLANILVARPD